MSSSDLSYTTADILNARPAKNQVDPTQPYAFLVEREASANGTVVDVATLFLTNRECPFHCLMCDLWKNTTDESIASGLIPRQMEFALRQLPPAQHIKLYNSGNFFDPKAIPRQDYPAIAELCRSFEHVVVENHPLLCNSHCLEFRELLGETTFEVALGLETVHPHVLPKLNKQMTLDDFARAVEFLREHSIAVRSFILLNLPFVSDASGVDWALKSMEYAFSLGVGCCSVIPTRTGNGLMEKLSAEGQFSEPRLSAVENVLESGISEFGNQGRVIVDLWDLERFADCRLCVTTRKERLEQMNLMQQILPRVTCCCEAVR